MGIGKFLLPISNWKVVVLSFLGATTFWFFSALGKEYNTRIKYPLEFIFDRDSLVVMRPLADYVELDVTGGGWDLFRQSFWFNVDPISIEPENPVSIKFLSRPTIIPIVRDHLNQFQINFLYTDTLYLNIEPKISKQVVLDIDSLSLDLDDNHRVISAIQVVPDTAVIYGPKSFIDTLQSKYHIPIDEEDIDRTFNRYISLGLMDGFNIASEPNVVQVMFEVDRFDELQMPVSLELLNFPDDSSALPVQSNVDVKFVVQRSLREDFFSEDFKVIADYDMMNKGGSTIPAIVMIHPENAIEVEAEPDTVKITFRE